MDLECSPPQPPPHHHYLHLDFFFTPTLAVVPKARLGFRLVLTPKPHLTPKVHTRKPAEALEAAAFVGRGTQQPQVVNIWDSRYLDAHVGFGDPPVFGFDPTHETPCPPRFWRLRVQFWPRYFDEAGEKCVCGFDPRAHSISTPSPAEKIQHISLHLQRKQQNSHLSRVDDRLFKLGQNISNRTRALRSLLQPHEWGNIKECQDKGVAKIPQILLK